MQPIEIVKTNIRAEYMYRVGTGSSVRKLKRTIKFKPKRKLMSYWTCEPADDLDAEFGLDLIAELTAALKKELSNNLLPND